MAGLEPLDGEFDEAKVGFDFSKAGELFLRIGEIVDDVDSQGDWEDGT